MSRRTAALLSVALAIPAAAAGTTATASAAAAAAPPTVQTLHFKVTTGTPGDSTDPNATTCDIVGDLYTPAGDPPAGGWPAILTTNGFGGSKADQAAIGQQFGARGYVVLSYSGLGFGGSGCNITTDDRQHDGKAASQLVSYLGGADGIAYTSYSYNPATGQQWSNPAPPLTVVKHDTIASDGQTHANDPRVGMIGGSYGGQIQFATAAVDPRVDTIVPLITWNDLVYSLTPGNGVPGVTDLTAGAPGVFKREWSDFFTGFGAAQVAEYPNVYRPVTGCPDFTAETCSATTFSNANGYSGPDGAAYFRNASVASYYDKIKIPVFFGQGQADTLFDLQEAVATYSQLKARGVPVKMMWQSWGHSRIGAAPGEYPVNGSTYDATYQGRAIIAWFDHYLADSGPAPALDFSYFRDWVYNSASGTDLEKATQAYAVAPTYPVGSGQTFALSGTGALVPAGATVEPGSATVTSPGDGAAQSVSEVSVVGVFGSYENPVPGPPPSDPPGTFAAYSTAPLTTDTDVVGIPQATVHLAGVTGSTPNDPGSQLVVFAKLYDVAPDGSKTLVEHLISPVRVKDPTQPVEIALPGIVHRVPAGHTLQFVLASSDSAYAGNTPGRQFSVVTGPDAPSTVTIPTVAASDAAPAAVVPEAPVALLLPLVAAGLLGVAAWRRRAA